MIKRTSEISHRKKKLLQLQHELIQREDAILRALFDDFRKSVFEGVATETALVRSELAYTIRKLSARTKPQWVWPSLVNFPSVELIYREPYGKVLVIAPWNYPFLLSLMPVIAAFAAGNQVVLKPSEHAPHTARIIAELIAAVFEPDDIEVIQGDYLVSESLLNKKWDYIFFTGSTKIGKLVAQAAAQNLTPVTLELGGKSPCIVDQTASLEVAAKRIVWGKFLNAGQTCVAPDFLIVQESIKNELANLLKKEIIRSYGPNPELSPDYPRIINASHWNRLCSLMKNQKIMIGGETIEHEFYIAPTLVDEPALDSAIMQEEIFGPILPILTYHDISELDALLSGFEKPLALYVFSNDKNFVSSCINKYSYGGGCINDVAVHLAGKRLPFGGVGQSGMGAYHGKYSFETFSHRKSILIKSIWPDIPIRYAPYNDKIKWVKKILQWL